MFGWMNAPITPAMSVCTPMTVSSSGCDQPASDGVWAKTSASTARPVPTATEDWISCATKFARYCSSFRAPTRRYSPNSRTACISAAHRREAPDREAPADPDHDCQPDDPHELGGQAAHELSVREITDERFDG